MRRRTSTFGVEEEDETFGAKEKDSLVPSPMPTFPRRRTRW
jgi:hypothetical protein